MRKIIKIEEKNLKKKKNKNYIGIIMLSVYLLYIVIQYTPIFI